MKKLLLVIITTLLAIFAFNACEKKTPIDNPPQSAQSVNDWIYEEMKVYYLWNHKIPTNPDYSLDPKSFFYGLINKHHPTDNPDGDRFSWIQDNYEELLNLLSGVSSDDIGFEYYPFYIQPGKPEVEMRVVYAKEGTDAAAKGVKRGQHIRAVNGVTITSTNYKTIFSGMAPKTLSRVHFVKNAETGEYELLPMEDVTVQMQSQFAENPVLFDSVYSINNKKIGYLIYNFFARDRGNGSYEYDKELMNTLSSIKAKNATEMVLDLRYNSGGAVSSAIALASALVKNRSTENLLVRAQYNDLVQEELRKKYGDDYFNTYFLDKIMNNSTLIAQIPEMNFSNLYILTGKRTASASELIINGLMPYMDKITLIGDTTYGKNVGSISIYKKNDPNNKWGMQPIVVKFYNSVNSSDFTTGFKPEAVNAINEFSYPLLQFGEIEEPLLGRALELITGKKSPRSAIFTSEKAVPLPQTGRKARFEMVDDVRDNTLRDLMKK